METIVVYLPGSFGNNERKFPGPCVPIETVLNLGHCFAPVDYTREFIKNIGIAKALGEDVAVAATPVCPEVTHLIVWADYDDLGTLWPVHTPCLEGGVMMLY